MTTIIHAYILDGAGVPHPLSNLPITFSVSGPAELQAVGNGDPTCTESFKSSTISAFHGCCAAYIRVFPQKGRIKVTAKAAGLPLAKCVLTPVTNKIIYHK